MGTKRRRGVWLALLIVVLTPLGLLYWQTRAAQAEVEREVSALKALGVPTSVSEIRRYVAAPDADNAAPLYRKAFDSLKAHGDSQPTASDPSDATLETRIREWVEANEGTLALTEQASQKAFCDFKRQWEQGAALLLPEFAQMKTLVKLAAARAKAEAERGRYDESMRWLRVGDKVAYHANEPILIGMLVSIAGEAIVHAEFQSQVEAYGKDAGFRRAASRFLAGQGPLPDLQRGLVGEVFFVRISMEQMRSGALRPEDIYALSSGGGSWGPDFLGRLRFASLKVPLVSAQVESKLLGRYRKAYQQMRGANGTLMAQIEASKRLDAGLLGDRSWSGVLAEVFVPVFAQAGASVVRLAATRRLSEAGLALWSIRAQTGSFPRTLPGEPWALDPFTDKPFVYVPGTGGFKLHSVGPNGKDDGGTWSSSKTRTDDVEFAKMRVPKRIED